MRTCILILLLVPCVDYGQLDTPATLKELAIKLKSIREVRYDYQIDAKFPNGDTDRISGFIYLNLDDELYYNASDDFTIIYSDRWYYYADHRSKLLTVVDLKKQDKKEIALRKKQIFESASLSTVVDSMFLKEGVIEQQKQTLTTNFIKLRFRRSNRIKCYSIELNKVDGTLERCDAEMTEPFDKTSKGVRNIRMTTTFKNFKYRIDKSDYLPKNYFEVRKKAVVLKKYNGYKLSKNI